MRLSGFMPEPGSPVDRIASLVIANLLWTFCAMLILPLPAATAALFATIAPLAPRARQGIFLDLFQHDAAQWLKSTVLVLVDVALGGLVLVNLQALETMPLPELLVWFLRSLTLLIGLTLVMTNLYLWPLLVLFDLPLKRLLVVSIQLTLAHPLRSLLTLVLGAAPLLLGLFLPLWLLAVGLVSVSVLGINWGSWKVISMRASAEELADLDDPMRGP